MQYWARFEQFARDLTKTYSDVHVFSGPLYMPTRAAGGKWVISYEVLRGEDGQGQVAVPTHFFKVILAERRGGVALGAFILPNKPIPPDIPLADFTVDLTVIERAHCPTLASPRARVSSAARGGRPVQARRACISSSGCGRRGRKAGGLRRRASAARRSAYYRRDGLRSRRRNFD